MTDISASDIPRVLRARPQVRADDVPLPKPQAFCAPVFMTDAVTPLAGETVLSLLWKKLERDRDA